MLSSVKSSKTRRLSRAESTGHVGVRALLGWERMATEKGEYLELAPTATITINITRRTEVIHPKESGDWSLVANPRNVYYSCL